ncbi:MAG: hypothetical protein R3300_20790 [Candidatus Promineifilaceae bacterium]|nr:hypothetical protein [Candidatus Promineifilaceae bacterium]
MIYLYIRQTIADYGQWKEAFDMHFSARQAGGATHKVLVLRDVDNAQQLLLLLGWRDLRQAHTFIRSVSWQMALQEMGVVGVPEVLFLETAA